MIKNLKIVIVAGPNDEVYIRKNIHLITSLNRESENNYSIDIIDNGFMISPELGFQEDIDSARILLGQPAISSYPDNCRASYQHASALNQYMHSINIDDEFILVLDPDFFITRSNWIDELITHASTNKLSFFGSVWAPKWFKKYRHFPTVHCMLIDTRRVNISELDFLPNLIVNTTCQASESNNPSNPLFASFNSRHYISATIDIIASFNQIKNSTKG